MTQGIVRCKDARCPVSTFFRFDGTSHFVYSLLVPSHPPVHVRAVNQSSTSITVSWNRVPKGHRRGKIIAYIVKITDLSTGNYTVEEYLNNRTRNVTIHNLKKYTFYEITVSAKTSKGASDPSASYPVQTAEDGKLIIP